MKNRKNGFALVIALSLMAFVLLLLLSITTLVQVETITAVASKEQLEARMSAQLGAMIALGDLQKLAGPDQRVTSRSDLLVAPDDSPIQGQAQWTGVWSSRPYNEVGAGSLRDAVAGLDIDGAADLRRSQWLVSGDPDDLANPVTGVIKDISSDPDVITIASNGRAVASDSDEVVVLKMPVTGRSDNTVAEYAYWVSDEGVKARVNLDDPHAIGSDSGSSYYRMATAQQGDGSAARNQQGARPYSADGAVSVWKGIDTGVGKVASASALPLIKNGADGAVQDFFHDFSAVSKTVLANTRNGGLRRDLSAVLVNLPAELERPMFDPATGDVDDINDGDPGGPLWQQLADYYQSGLAGDPGTITMSVPTNDAISYAPVMTRFQMANQVFAERRAVGSSIANFANLGDGSATVPANDDKNGNGNYHDDDDDYAHYYEFTVGYFPLISLWNPYDKPMVLPGDLAVSTQAVDLNLYYWPRMSGSDIDNCVKVGQFTTMNSFDWPGGNGSSNKEKEGTNRRMVNFTISSAEPIPPGGVVNFSPPNNSIISLKADNESSTRNRNVLKPGGLPGGLLNGFFTRPIVADFDNGTSYDYRGVDRKAAVYGGWDNVNKFSYGLRWGTRRHKDEYANGGQMWRATTDLYYPDPYGNSDAERFYMNRRFFTTTTPGFGNWKTDGLRPKILLASDFPGFGLNNGSIKQIGDSVGANPDDRFNSPLDVEGIKRVANDERLYGISSIMGFPKSAFLVDRNEGRPHLFSQFNPRAPMFSQQPLSWDYHGGYMYKINNPGGEVSWSSRAALNFYDSGIDTAVGLVGVSNVLSGGGSEQAVLFEVPTTPVLGIGQLMQAGLMNVESVSNTQWDGSGHSWDSNLQAPHTSPSYAIGNSFANIHLPLNKTSLHAADNSISEVYGNWPPMSIAGATYDYSYLLNEVLWDDFYFSTILPDTVGLEAPNPVLPNSRIQKWNSAATASELRSEKEAAAHLMLLGGFNVNSTSVAAWESVLGALRDVPIASGSATSDSQDQAHNFSRFFAPNFTSTAEEFDYGIGDANDRLMAGFRNLTDDQISDLAEQIVREVRGRRSAYGYPFTSLSDFINRSINDEDIDDDDRKRYAYCGVLQYAMDRSSINGEPALDADWKHDGPASGGLWANDYISDNKSDLGQYQVFNDMSATDVVLSRPYIEGAAGTLMQADVLSKIGPLLAARSDTFTIRSYGESKDPVTGQGIAKAYFEMVVQRTPEYVDSSDPAEARLQASQEFQDVAEELNFRFGRRFEVVSYRWLDESEI